MVTAVFALCDGGAAELRSPDDEGVFHNAALLEVGKEGGNRLVCGEGVLGVAFDKAAMLIPNIGRADLDVTDTGFTEASDEKATVAELRGFLLVHSIEGFGGFGFLGDVDQIRGDHLHPVSHFVAFDHPVDLGVVGL